MAYIAPHLWHTDKAEEAAKFYVSIFPNSKVDRVTILPIESPSGPASTIPVVEYTLMGAPFQCIGAGPLDPFNHAVSFHVVCDTQKEIDQYWHALLEGGGQPEQCGWLKDRYGVFWQVSPKQLGDWIGDSDKAKARRVAEAMMKMVKIDLPTLENAYKG